MPPALDLKIAFPAARPPAMGMYLAAAVLCCVLAWRVWAALPARVTGSGDKRAYSHKRASQTVHTLVVLGSGGHTSEMLELLRHFNRRRYTPLTFVLSATDTTSLPQAHARGVVTTADRADGDANTGASAVQCVRITRSREVGQGWVSTVRSTARACVEAALVVFTRRPALVLCNGPGVCVPVVFAAFLLRMLGPASILSGRPQPTIVFCESFCRVKSLSMTGKIMYYIADRFIVHWPELQGRFPLSEYLGQIY